MRAAVGYLWAHEQLHGGGNVPIFARSMDSIDDELVDLLGRERAKRVRPNAPGRPGGTLERATMVPACLCLPASFVLESHALDPDRGV
jgi:hypothetical protein